MEAILNRTACICGKRDATSFGEHDGIELVRCECGIVRRAELDPQDYLAQYMDGFYHNENNETVVNAVIADRIDHDREVAKQRLGELAKLFAAESPGTILDVGCGNGAFVLEAIEQGWDAWGIDLYLPDTARKIRTKDGRPLKERLEVADLGDCRFTRRTVDVIMLNDVIEHLPDPLMVLEQAAGIVKRNGMIVIDTPDFVLEHRTDSGLPIESETEYYDLETLLDSPAGHHVKPAEHIWYLQKNHWTKLFERAGLKLIEWRTPIAGKSVFYLQPDDRTLDVIVRGPTGLGDVHWILLKMRALRESEEPCTLTLSIPGNGDPALIFRSKGFLNMLPFLDQSKLEISKPVIVDAWAEDVRKPLYEWIANGHLERGLRIETWNPHLKTDYDYPVNIPEEAAAWAKDIRETVGGRLVVMYASSKAWNYTISNEKEWGPIHWAALVENLAHAGIKPVLIGKHWDMDFSSLLAQTIKHPYLDLTGQTDEAQALALMKEAAAVVGMCAGITILAVHLRVPSILFWPEFGVGEKNKPMPMNKGFQDDWVDPEQIKAGIYRPLSLGAFGVSDVLVQLEKWGVI